MEGTSTPTAPTNIFVGNRVIPMANVVLDGPIKMTGGVHIIGKDASLRSILKAWWKGSRKL